MIDLNSFVPDFLLGIIEMKAIQNAVSIHINELQDYMKNVQSQKYIQTASGAGLNYWEKEYGLITDPNLSDALRKESIFAKIRGMGTITKDKINQIANTYSGSEVELTEVPAEYRFIIKFVGNKGVPANMLGLIETINEVKPAHLDYEFAYTYNTWDMVSFLIWSNVSAKTWSTIKTTEKFTLTFTDIVNGSFVDNTFTKTGTVQAHDSGFRSVETFSNGQYVEFTVTNLVNVIFFGLGSGVNDVSYTTIDFAININTNNLKIYENGVLKYTTASVAINDKARLVYVNNTIKYFLNDVLLYTSATTPATSLYIDAEVYTPNAQISNINYGKL